MGRCRYNLSEECYNKDCVKCILEKIRAEINFIAEKCLPNSLAEEYEVKGMKTTIEIIDRRIAELKGEQK